MKPFEITLGRLLGLSPIGFYADPKRFWVLRQFERLRFFFIEKINTKYEQSCWSKMVDWALGIGYDDYWSKWDFWIEDWSLQMCSKANKNTPYAYCGKCKRKFEVIN